MASVQATLGDVPADSELGQRIDWAKKHVEKSGNAPFTDRRWVVHIHQLETIKSALVAGTKSDYGMHRFAATQRLHAFPEHG